ncbi:hypothetical protein FACS1894191_5630 [Clostridia bacterium]|nr:hypothetical protein FACS1894191_5630 [Clostridia bacterium]
MNKKWYVLYVCTGSEPEVSRLLNEKGITSMVVRETRMIRRGGRWNEETRTVFPGYVFLYMQYTVDMHYIIKGIRYLM